MKKGLAFVVSIVALAGLTGCGNKTPATFIDATSGSIYGTISNFSLDPQKGGYAGDALTFTVTPAQYYFIDTITNNGNACKRVSTNPDGSVVYTTTLSAGKNVIRGTYFVDQTVDFVDEFKLNISDEIFTEVMSKKSGAGQFTDLDFRRAGIEQCKAPNKWSSGKKSLDTSVFVNYVDGDTTHVETYNLGYTVKIRYLSIDTPESTSEIEEWGLTASYYSKYIYTGDASYKQYLESTTDLDNVQAGISSLILISDAAAYYSDIMTKDDLMIGSEEEGLYAATTDGNQRNLAYVWYATKENPTKNDFRCLNLEMVYQGFSTGVGSPQQSSPYYYKMFNAANNSARDNGRHLFSGEEDPNYFYYEEKTVQELTLTDLYASAPTDPTIGYLPQSGYANRKTLYKIKGYVTRKVGTSFYMQEKCEYTQEEINASQCFGIYIFTYSITPIRTGDYVEVIGAISSYGGTFQMQGISFQTLDPNPNRDTRIISRNNKIVPIKVDPAQFNTLKLQQVLVELTSNIWFFNFQSTYGGELSDLGEGGSEEVNKYNTAYPFYNTSNSPIFYASFGATDNADELNESTKGTSSGVRYSDNVIRFTVDQEVLVTYGPETALSYKFFTGGSYMYNEKGAQYANKDDTNKYKDLTVDRVFNRKACKYDETGHGLIVISCGYESTSGNRKMSAKICSGSTNDITLYEVI